MGSKINYVLVGLFVSLFTVALVIVGLWLSTSTAKKEYETYIAYFYESVSGLNPKAPVKYRGVEVGQVKDIALDPDNPERVRLLLDIERGVPVKVDTIAILATQGITGLAFIDLTGGSKNAQALKPDEHRRYAEISTGPSLITRMDTAVTDLIGQLSKVAGQAERVAERVESLLGDENQAAMAGILQSFDEMTRTFAKQSANIQGVLENFDTLSRNTAQASGELPQMLQRVNRSLEGIENMVNSAGETVDGANRLVKHGENQLLRVSGETLPELNQLLSRLQSVAENLDHISQDVERDPNILLFGRPQAQPGPGEN